MNAIFGPNTPRVLQFLISLRKLTEAEIDQVASTWSQINPVDRALTWAHLQLATAAKEEYPVMAAASAARRPAGIRRTGRAGSSSGRRGRSPPVRPPEAPAPPPPPSLSPVGGPGPRELLRSAHGLAGGRGDDREVRGRRDLLHGGRRRAAADRTELRVGSSPGTS